MIAERATKSARDAIDAALKAKYHQELRSGSIMWWPHDHRRTNAANIKRPASMRWLSLAEKEFEPEGFAGSRDRAFIAE
jgi:hypothetical protein